MQANVMGNTTRTLCIAVGIVASCTIGLPNLYDNFLMARFIPVAVGLAIVFLLALVGKKGWRVPNSPIFSLYLLFVLFSGCSIFWATNTAEAIFAFATQLLTPLIIILFYSLLSTNRKVAQRALWVAAAVVLAVCLLFAVAQLLHIESFSFGQLYRVSGINGHKNLLSAMLFLLSAFLLTSFSIFESKTPKWLSVILFAVAFAVIVVLKSRAVLIGAIVAAAVFGLMLLVPRHRKGYRVTLIASIVLAYAFFTVGLRWFAARSVPHSTEKSEVETKMLSTSSLAERCLLWEKTYQIVDSHPFVGCGIGNWQIHFPGAGLKGLYRADVWNVNFTKPHNEYLGVLSETGYVGLLLYVIFLVSLMVKASFALRETDNRKDFLYGAIVLGLFVGSCANALFDFPNSRIEHIVWTAILMAILFQSIDDGEPRILNKGWNAVFLLVALTLVVIGGFRYKGERNAFRMQQALKNSDFKAVERHCRRALSVFYNIDPVGLPMYWYLGKAEKAGGHPQALVSFRLARHHAPFCKENLNDLGLAEYYTAHDLAEAEACFKEAIRISPNYLYPYLNLAYVYLRENEPQKAKEMADQIQYDEHKRDILKADAVFFEPLNFEVARQKIDADFKAVMQLRQAVSDKTKDNFGVCK
ncbi:MAG: O-antigen ligase family protein [Bacteroidales bacterium]|nr:O-antigen ligase family protein [Bacteroidales bacterium]